MEGISFKRRKHLLVMAKDIKKEYSNGELTVVWQPAKCIHSEVCVKTLPNVYDPKARPWINVANATTEELKAQIDLCPSGALSYYMNNEQPGNVNTLETKVEVLENGPLLIHGNLTVTHKDGQSEAKTNKTAFCRCGHSTNKPYCDGSHAKVGFIG